MRRQRPAVLTALLVSWTGVWLAPWGAVLGGFVGMLAAGGFATGWAVEHHLYEIGAGPAVSVVSLSFGLVLGALAGCALAVAAGAANPVAGVVSVGLGGALTFAVVILLAALERSMLGLRGYRRLSRDEARRVAPLLQQVAVEMELNGLPRFAMSDTVLPNAWTHMRTIVLTAGLLEMLDDAELAAVLAHELHHWREGDAIGGPTSLDCGLANRTPTEPWKLDHRGRDDAALVIRPKRRRSSPATSSGTPLARWMGNLVGAVDHHQVRACANGGGAPAPV